MSRTASGGTSDPVARVRATKRAVASAPSEAFWTSPNVMMRYTIGTSRRSPATRNSIVALPRSSSGVFDGRIRDHQRSLSGPDEPDERERRGDVHAHGVEAVRRALRDDDIGDEVAAEAAFDGGAGAGLRLGGRRIGERGMEGGVDGRVLDDVSRVHREGELQHAEGEHGEQHAHEDELDGRGSELIIGRPGVARRHPMPGMIVMARSKSCSRAGRASSQMPTTIVAVISVTSTQPGTSPRS